MQPGPAQWLLALHARQLYGLCSHRTHQTQPIFSAQVLRTTGLWQLPSSSLSCCCCSASPAVAAELAQQMLETGICYILQPLMLNPISHVLSCPYPLHRAAVPDDDVLARMKHHVQGVLANLSAMMPCFALGSSKLPKVTGKKEKKQSCQQPFQGVTPTLCSLHCHQLQGNLHPCTARGGGCSPCPPSSTLGCPSSGVFSSTVSHHDTEIPFNPSFIESPSAAWVSDSSFSSSFDTDNEGPEYSVPPREGDVNSCSSSLWLP